MMSSASPAPEPRRSCGSRISRREMRLEASVEKRLYEWVRTAGRTENCSGALRMFENITFRFLS